MPLKSDSDCAWEVVSSAMTLEYRQLGKTTFRVSSIGLGCVTFGREIDAATSFRVLDRAIERGVNLLDTAAVYGNGASEEVIGSWLRSRRVHGRVVVATKVSGRLDRESIFRSVEGSLQRLGVEAIDLLQAHDWDPGTPLDETLEAFDGLVRQGKSRYLGCSNWQAGQLQQSMLLAQDRGWHRLESVQPMYNLFDRTIEGQLLSLCAQNDMGVITYSPLGAGFLTGKYSRDACVPQGTRFDVKPGHQRIYFTDHGFRIVEGLREIASRSQQSMVQLALSWVLSRPGITSVLVGARRPDHVDQAFQAMETRLESWMIDQLDRLSAITL